MKYVLNLINKIKLITTILILFIFPVNDVNSQYNGEEHVLNIVDSVKSININSDDIIIDSVIFCKTMFLKPSISNVFWKFYSISFFDRVRDFEDEKYYKPTDIISFSYSEFTFLLQGFLWTEKRDQKVLKSITCFDKENNPLYTIVIVENKCLLYISYDINKDDMVELNYFLISDSFFLDDMIINDLISFDEKKIFKLNISKEISSDFFLFELIYNRLW